MRREGWKGGRVVCWEGGKDERVVRGEGGKGGRIVSWGGGKGWRIVRRQGWRGWRAVTWQVGKGGRGATDMAMWERCEGSGVARWER